LRPGTIQASAKYGEYDMQTGRPVTIANHGMVASPHYLASQAGLRILQAGGNAVDAAVATAATLGVVMPHQTSIGGDAFWLIYKSDSQRLYALNASGRSPYNISMTKLHEQELTQIPLRGPLPVTVPGVVDGWCTCLEAHGSLPLIHVLESAIDYAENGFPVNVDLVRSVEQLQPILGGFEEWRRIFLKNGKGPGVGDILTQRELAKTLRTIAKNGRDAFYQGEIASRIVSSVQKQGGYLTHRDLAEHHSDWVNPLSTTYHDYIIYELPPNSRGAIVLIALNILEKLDIGTHGFLSAERIHLLAEAYRIAQEQVEAVCSDPEFVHSPLEKLLSKDFANELRSEINSNHRIDIVTETQGDTVYVAAVDAAGNAVSLIESTYYSFGSGLIVEETGISLQNRGAYFSLDPNHPNRLEPHKRTLHTLMPAMVFKNDQPWLVFGSMGGTGQAQTQLQILTNLIDFEFNVQQAIEVPRWVKGGTLVGESIGDLRIENRFLDETKRGLNAQGYTLTDLGTWSDRVGHAQAIIIDQAQKVLYGGADPRSEGIAAGW